MMLRYAFIALTLPDQRQDRHLSCCPGCRWWWFDWSFRGSGLRHCHLIRIVHRILNGLTFWLYWLWKWYHSIDRV